jgi:ribosomal-protein-alanine N-acetyltransferase
MQGLELTLSDAPSRRQQAAAMTVMDQAFDPAFGEAWTASQLAGILSMPGCWLTLAQLDGATLGFALIRTMLDESELLLLAVHPDWQRHALGSALLCHSIETARSRGIATMHLEVRSSNSAIALYKKMGFQHVNIRPGYYRGADGQLHDAYSFRLDLKNP